MEEAYLILENGTVFRGRPFGYGGRAVGELVFSTSMTGYLETLTDPCHYGHIVLQTFPLIGNAGVISDDFASVPDRTGGAAKLKAYIVRQWCQEPSNFRSEGNLDAFLRHNRIPGLYGIDTRALTRIIRENGSINAMISPEPTLSGAQWDELRSYKITGAVEAVSEKREGQGADKIYGPILTPGQPEPKANILLWDFGSTVSLLNQLAEYGCRPKLIAGSTATADDIIAHNPDGIILSDGPGDPAGNTRIIEEIKKLCGDKYENKIPVFGVGLGHQMLAIAKGAATEKLHFGHRGANYPVRETETGRAFVTKQNHGFTVTPGSLPDSAKVSYVNVNDGTCEGIQYDNVPAFSVQFHPPFEIAGQLVRRFVEMTEEKNHAAR